MTTLSARREAPIGTGVTVPSAKQQVDQCRSNKLMQQVILGFTVMLAMQEGDSTVGQATG